MIDARVRDVTRELNANSIDAPELRSALATLYGMSSIPEPYVVEYSGTDAMRVFYSGEAVVKVTVARSTNDDRVEEIREHIENALGVPGQESVATAILFSYGSRVTGYWRYGQQALIAPIPDGAPTAGMEAADHPFLVQFAYPESPHHLVRGLRTRYRSRELELLLNVFLMAQIRRLSQSPSHSWVFRPRESDEPLRSTFSQAGYVIGVDLDRSRWLSTDGWAELDEANPNDYYSQLGWEVGKGLGVPTTLKVLLDRYYGLPLEKRRLFFRAAYWFQQSALVGYQSRSLAFTTLASCIEALVPKGGERCPECRQERRRLSARFREFMEWYVPGSPDPDYVRRITDELYGARSTVSHGDMLMLADEKETDWGLDPLDWKQQSLLLDGIRLVRTALINWLSSADDDTC